MNARGLIALWVLACLAALSVITVDWRPVALGMIVTLALAGSGPTRRPPQPPAPS